MPSDDQNAIRGLNGEVFIKKYFEDKGYTVRKRKRGEKAFDLLANKGHKHLLIEVKTSRRFEGGIPDMHSTEFKMHGDKLSLVADLLCIVRLDEENNPKQLDILTKEEIDKYSHKIINRIRLSSTLKTDLRNKKIGKSISVC